MEHISKKTKKITLMGILLAMTVILSLIEHALPSLPFLPPNTRLGLSNVIVMYTLFFMGSKYAYLMTILKSLFVSLTRGLIAGFMSISGGLLSITIMVVLYLILNDKISYIILSIFGAIGHNLGQMVAASFQMQANLVAYYWPILLISGVIFGVVTGILLQVVMPIFNKISGLSPAIIVNNKKEIQ